ncbi:hypothetical protein ACVWYH_009564 [Bradyrhizobium sp. GM24.11]
MTGLVQRVEEDEQAVLGGAGALHKAVGIARRGLQPVEAGHALVVIADHRDVRHFQRGHRVGEIGVGFRLAPMGEVAGHDGEGGVGLVRIDVGDRRIEPGARVEAIELQPGVREMRVGDVDEFERHGALVWDCWRMGASGKTALTGRSLERMCFSLMTAVPVSTAPAA